MVALFNWDFNNVDECRQALGIFKQSVVQASKNQLVMKDAKLTDFQIRLAHGLECVQLVGNRNPPISYEEYVDRLARHLKKCLGDDFTVMLKGQVVTGSPNLILVVKDDTSLRAEITSAIGHNRMIEWHELNLPWLFALADFIHRRMINLETSLDIPEHEQVLFSSMVQVFWVVLLMIRTYHQNSNPEVRHSLIVQHLEALNEFEITVE